MDFGFNADQEMLRATARKFFENECTSDFVRARMAEAGAFTEEFWTKLAEQGWLGLVYPEEYGGAGLGFVDLTVLMEEMGRAVMPGPFFSTVPRPWPPFSSETTRPGQLRSTVSCQIASSKPVSDSPSARIFSEP